VGSCRCEFFAAVAGLIWPRRSAPTRLVASQFHFVEAGAKDAHGFGAIFDLGFFVLLRDDKAGRQVRDAHGGVGRIDGLTTGTGGAEGINAQIFGFDLMSMSSASGRTATVAALVWMRPCVSVAGTRWTRWTPLSYFNFE